MLNFASAATGSGLSYGGGAATDVFKAGTKGLTSGGGGLSFGQFAGGALSVANVGMSFADGLADNPLGIAKQAASVGSLIPGAGMIFAGLGMGLSALEAFLPSEAELNVGKEARANVFAGLERDIRNQAKHDAFVARLETVAEQLKNNRLAAERSYVNTQQNLNQTDAVSAFQQSGMLKQLLEVAGAYGAREVYGKGAARMADVMSYGQYGIANRQRIKQKTENRIAAVESMKSTTLALKAANDRAMASIGPPPIMEMGYDMPYSNVGDSPFKTGLKIASASLPAIEKGWSMTAPGGSFFGITKPETAQQMSGGQKNNPLSISSATST
jgi:hypothetical protein